MSPHLQGGGHIDLGADRVGISTGVSIGIGVTLSCLHNIMICEQVAGFYQIFMDI